MEPSIDWRVCKTRGSSVEVDCMRSKRVESIMQMNKEGGSKVTPSLLGSEEGMRSGHWKSVSGPARSFLETWIIFRSKSERSRSQWT